LRMEDGIYRVLVFGRRKVGSTRKRYVDTVKVYLDRPVKGVKPLFEARIGKEVVKLALDRFNASYMDRGIYMILSGENVDESIRRFVVFSGVRQTANEFSGKHLLEIVASMGEIEVLFWHSKFVGSYERGGYWDVYRVAKSFKTLYRI
jgi:hypothetical protein